MLSAKTSKLSMNIELVKSLLEKEWNVDEGFVWHCRQGEFDEAGYERLVGILSQIDLGDSPTIDRRLVSLIWWLPQVMRWQEDRIVSQGGDQNRYLNWCENIERLVQDILGVP
jgi:hypothetical protein